MAPNALRNIRYGGAYWYLLLALFGYLAVAPLVFLVQGEWSALNVSGTLVMTLLSSLVFLILLGKHPRIAPGLVDTDDTFRPIAIRLIAGTLTVAFLLIAVLGTVMIGREKGAVAVLIIGGLFALIFGFLLKRSWGGSHRVDAKPFGLSYPGGREARRHNKPYA